jgi:cellulose synthase/poly-beta-1,6-N-acetylglucosamine synthase-like glycosyltransferase
MEEGTMIVVFYCSLLLLVFYVLLIGIYNIGWLMIGDYKPKENTFLQSFSVLIPARNEEENIGACLDSIIQQKYPVTHYEIIVIDDHSTDRTAEVVTAFITQHPGAPVKLLQMHDDPAQRKLKKEAITYGIKYTNNRYIILTDADCTRGSKWLDTISSFITEKRSRMIYAPVEFKANNIFEKIQSLEFAGLVGIGAAAIRLKNPNMCSAANLVFEKSVFEEVGGYKGNDGVASGDDEFLLHKVFKKYPGEVHFLKHYDAIVQTTANTSLKQLADQRRRWVSKSTKYEDRYITAIMAGAYLFNAAVLFYLLQDPLTGLFFLLAKTGVEALFLYHVMRFYKRTRYLWFLPLAEIFHILYVLIIGIWGNLGAYNWKGRSVK